MLTAYSLTCWLSTGETIFGAMMFSGDGAPLEGAAAIAKTTATAPHDDQGVTTAAVQPGDAAAGPFGHAACSNAGDGLFKHVGWPNPLALTGCPPTGAMSWIMLSVAPGATPVGTLSRFNT